MYSKTQFTPDPRERKPVADTGDRDGYGRPRNNPAAAAMQAIRQGQASSHAQADAGHQSQQQSATQGQPGRAGQLALI